MWYLQMKEGTEIGGDFVKNFKESHTWKSHIQMQGQSHHGGSTHYGSYTHSHIHPFLVAREDASKTPASSLSPGKKGISSIRETSEHLVRTGSFTGLHLSGLFKGHKSAKNGGKASNKSAALHPCLRKRDCHISRPGLKSYL